MSIAPVISPMRIDETFGKHRWRGRRSDNSWWNLWGSCADIRQIYAFKILFNKRIFTKDPSKIQIFPSSPNKKTQKIVKKLSRGSKNLAAFFPKPGPGNYLAAHRSRVLLVKHPFILEMVGWAPQKTTGEELVNCIHKSETNDLKRQMMLVKLQATGRRRPPDRCCGGFSNWKNHFLGDFLMESQDEKSAILRICNFMKCKKDGQKSRDQKLAVKSGRLTLRCRTFGFESVIIWTMPRKRSSAQWRGRPNGTRLMDSNFRYWFEVFVVASKHKWLLLPVPFCAVSVQLASDKQMQARKPSLLDAKTYLIRKLTSNRHSFSNGWNLHVSVETPPAPWLWC